MGSRITKQRSSFPHLSQLVIKKTPVSGFITPKIDILIYFASRLVHHRLSNIQHHVECHLARSRRPMRCVAKRVNKQLICLLSIPQTPTKLSSPFKSSRPPWTSNFIGQKSLTRGRIVLLGGSYRVQDWEYAGGGCKMSGISNVRAVLRLHCCGQVILQACKMSYVKL